VDNHVEKMTVTDSKLNISAIPVNLNNNYTAQTMLEKTATYIALHDSSKESLWLGIVKIALL